MKKNLSIVIFVTGFLITSLGVYLNFQGIEEISKQIDLIFISYFIDSLLLFSYFVLLGISASPLTIVGLTLLFNGIFILFIPFSYFIYYLNKFGGAEK